MPELKPQMHKRTLNICRSANGVALFVLLTLLTVMRWNYNTLQAIHKTTIPIQTTLSSSLQPSKPIDETPHFEEPVHVRIITGTHSTAKQSPNQAESCVALAVALEALWTAWTTHDYSIAKEAVQKSLRAIKVDAISCHIGANKLQWTFPLTFPASTRCDAKTKEILEKRTWIKGTKVLVPWFLLRPDLVTLEKLVLELGLKMEVIVTVNRDHSTAAFTQEGCPRFNTVLNKRVVYKQRLHLVALSDLQYQLSKLIEARVIVNDCSAPNPSPNCPIASTDQRKYTAHELSLEAMPLFAKPTNLMTPLSDPTGSTDSDSQFLDLKVTDWAGVVKKRVSDGKTTLVFVAGLEGVGHHMFAKLGAKHTVRGLYDSLTNYLCDVAWSDVSEELYSEARARLVRSMEALKTTKDFSDGSRVFFLNTVFSEKAVNMYSYPWGGPRCYLKRFARVICNIDTIELAQMAEEAGVDFRIVVLRRSIGAAVVSASLHRPYGTLVSEARMLIQSWALLKTGLTSIDPNFSLEISYEDLLNKPEQSAEKLTEHLNVPRTSPLHQRFVRELKQSAVSHPIGDVEKWKTEVSQEELKYMQDILYL